MQYKIWNYIYNNYINHQEVHTHSVCFTFMFVQELGTNRLTIYSYVDFTYSRDKNR